MWIATATSVRGNSHELSGLPCQDYSVQHSDDSISLVVVSDGAGSAKYADIGARTLCNVISEELIAGQQLYFPSHIRKYNTVSKNGKLTRRHRNLFEKIYTEFFETIKNLDYEDAKFSDFSATCLFVCVKDGNYIAGHIGDGVIGVQKRNALDVLSFPDNGEFANSTYFITSSDANEHFRVYSGPAKPVLGFVLLSDGTAESLFDKGDRKFAPVVSKLVKENGCARDSFREELRESVETVVKQATGDDCSIAILTRRSI